MPGVVEMTEPFSEPKVQFQVDRPEDKIRTIVNTERGPTAIKEPTPPAEAEKMQVPEEIQILPEVRKGQEDRPFKSTKEVPHEVPLPKNNLEVHKPNIPQGEIQQLTVEVEDKPIKLKQEEKRKEHRESNEEEMQPPKSIQKDKDGKPPSDPKDVSITSNSNTIKKRFVLYLN